ncbi:hypothetical protein [Photobacterium iliopiscarium]|uniref:Uncharacterized protein n=1 Tax=Photobacterium iliopiscarium TaxID=56192 RepID=A0A2T3MF41_9GAMM|nr:hypothetical protein [Photobacterium iliopiscarium]PSV92417.1 hypothetical protein C9I88_16330 [Photobacterium iliopiscarium]
MNTKECITFLENGTISLKSIAEQWEDGWNPEQEDPALLHDNYIKCLVSCYVSKYADLSTSIIHAVKSENYFAYALAGRALIEITATLHYYINSQYIPLLSKDVLTVEDMNKLIEISDKHLRGGRFDWATFLERDFDKMREDVRLKIKNKGKAPDTDSLLKKQVNVVTCLNKWAKQTPEVMIAYDLFCDLVHPNIGSSFLVASVSKDGLFFTKNKGEQIGKQVVDETFVLLLSIAHREFGELIQTLLLMAGSVKEK